MGVNWIRDAFNIQFELMSWAVPSFLSPWQDDLIVYYLFDWNRRTITERTMATDVDYAYSTGPSSYSNDDVIGFLLRMVNQATSASSLVDNHQQQYQRDALSSSWSGATGSQGDKAMYTASNESDVWSDYQMYSDIDPYGNGSFYQRSNNSSSSSDHVMTWPQRTAWITIFSLMLFVATVGNALVAWIVLGQYVSTSVSPLSKIKTNCCYCCCIQQEWVEKETSPLKYN